MLCLGSASVAAKGSPARGFRYLRFAFDLVQYYGFFKLTPHINTPGDEAVSSSQLVTIVSCTLGAEEGYEEQLRSWLRCNPKAIIIVTVDAMLKPMEALLQSVKSGKIVLCTVSKPNFRQQMSEGIRRTTTELIVFADDDSTWSAQTLTYLIAPFSDASIGGVNTMQQVRPSGPNVERLNMWEAFGALNLVRRNVLHSALAYFNNGQVLNLSGRTVAYRTRILKQESFFKAFANDRWRGRHRLKTGDDNFLTNWTIHHGWRTCFQNHPDAMITTTVNADATYLKQVLRWSRDTARSYLRDIGHAMRTGKRQDYVRCILNCTANYASDFAILAELSFIFGVAAFWALGNRTPFDDHKM